MQFRSSLALAATTVLLITACGNNAASTRPSTAASTSASVAPATASAAAPSAAAPSATTAAASASAPAASASAGTGGSAAAGEWKIGVVADVGTVDDKNFNQYSYEGAQLGAQAVGAEDPQFVVPASNSEYAGDIQNFIDQDYNLIVTVGFNLNTDTLKAAKANPDVWFIGVDQSACVDETGAPDPDFGCAGNASQLLPNFVGLQYQEDQAGYLAGIVAASLSENKSVGAIGGINSVPAVVRYIQGYELGAKSVDDSTKVSTGYVSTSDFGVAFNNPGEGKNYADQFIQTNHPDVLFQVAGKTGNGVLESACNNDLVGIGVDVDQWLSLNADTDAKYQCIVTSAEKHLSNSVQMTIQQIASGSVPEVDPFGALHFNATNDGIGISPEHDSKGLITSDIQTLIDNAIAGMKDGSLVTCPENCGTAQ